MSLLAQLALYETIVLKVKFTLGFVINFVGGSLWSQFVWVVSFIINKLPCSRINETVSLVFLFLHSNSLIINFFIYFFKVYCCAHTMTAHNYRSPWTGHIKVSQIFESRKKNTIAGRLLERGSVGKGENTWCGKKFRQLFDYFFRWLSLIYIFNL